MSQNIIVVKNTVLGQEQHWRLGERSGQIQDIFACRANRIVMNCEIEDESKGGIKDDSQGLYLRCWRVISISEMEQAVEQRELS